MEALEEEYEEYEEDRATRHCTVFAPSSVSASKVTLEDFWDGIKLDCR